MNDVTAECMQKLYCRNIWEDVDRLNLPENENLQGWNGRHPSLSRLTEMKKDRHVIFDIGVWKGLSTITMANCLRENGIEGCVIAIDTFLGSPEHWGKMENLFDRRGGRPDLFERFLRNVKARGLEDYIIPMPQTSVCAAMILKRLGVEATLIHLDAAHEYEEVARDIEEYWPLLEKGGFLIGDDYGPGWPGVVRAAGEFSAKTGLPLQIEFPKWIVKKPL